MTAKSHAAGWLDGYDPDTPRDPAHDTDPDYVRGYVEGAAYWVRQEQEYGEGAR